MRIDKSPITLYQVVEEDGTPYLACHTEPTWVDYSETMVFSEPTAGNKIAPLTSGKVYFEDLIKTFNAAQSEIYIAGWQVNWDALLANDIRLYDVLYAAAKLGVQIYIMPWDDTEPVQTYDDQTKVIFDNLNSRLKAEHAKGVIHTALCKSYASVNNTYYSHHQKQVIIDRKIAYIGGIDLAYGRFDDASYDLRANTHNRQVLNRYNPGIEALEAIDENSPILVDPDLMIGYSDIMDQYNREGQLIKESNAKTQAARVANGGWQIRYEEAGLAGIAANKASTSKNVVIPTQIDPTRQPRMPWQDVHCKIEGPAVSDLLRNFVLRWNTTSKTKLPLPALPKAYAAVGKAQIQVLRSAPAAHVERENKANAIKQGSATQKDIYVAMKNLIAKARHFIYIENQFFVSDFGEIGEAESALSPAGEYIKQGASGFSDTKKKAVRAFSHGNYAEMNQRPQNGILKALVERLKIAIVYDIKKPPFHIYITLPVHPEGSLNSASIAGQVFFTMQTIAFGSHSLLNSIKRCIKARELKDKKDSDYERVFEASNDEYKSIPTEACYDYVTLLNLRNWAELPGNGSPSDKRYVTEQIYVHSKCMIVDDRFAIVGSANINDRSLLGERDSEIAVLVMDTETKRADVNGKGSNQPVRLFAHTLRIEIWNKLFGITGNIRPANHLKEAIIAPGHPSSWKAIQAQATQNAALYEASFPWVPRSFVIDSETKLQISASVLPTWYFDNKKKTGYLKSPLPFQAGFWDKSQHNTSAEAGLSNIKGFMTALPVEWTKGENLDFKFPTAILVRNEDTNSSSKQTTQTASIDDALDTPKA